MIKVLLVDQNNAIAWKYTYSLANALQKQGVNISVITDLQSEKGFCKPEIIKIFNTDQKGISKVDKLKNYVSGYKKIITIIKEQKFDILHLQWITFSPVDYYFLKKISKLCKVVMTVHDIIAFDAHCYDKIYYKKVYGLMDELILQTEENVEQFKTLFPKVNSTKIHLCYHGHFLDFANVHGKAESREKLSLPKDKFIFMFFGQIKKVKGVDLLIQAFADVLKKYPNSYLLIAGKVWHNNFNPYQGLIEKLQLKDFVRTDIKFIPDEDVGYYFSACDIVCLPYTELYQSGVVQLSYSYKKPAIVSDLPAFLTVVKEQENGYVFKNGNIQSLSEAMNKAIENKDCLESLGQIGYQFIKDKFDWDKIAGKVVNIYANQNDKK